ncbi:unnamed protein product [Lactuca saligna]|uniref:Uncharacterized protein n=1 Tax=Lactuca saligna TaxID=75948 RepID=A0AA35VK02_LACSI|nr:unnamed protein product [Lactuca saligna]
MSKGKEKVFDDDDEEELISEGEKLVRKKRHKELDDLLQITKDLDEKEAKQQVMKVTLEAKALIFHPCSFDRIRKAEIHDPSICWLDPTVSFDIDNTADSQLDFPIAPSAFLFRCFKRIEKVPLSDYDVNHSLFLSQLAI